jgi:thiamine biosynthesis lipoprotein
VIAPPRTSRIDSQRENLSPEPIVPASFVARSMGGRLVVHLGVDGNDAEAQRASRRLVARIDCWAARLTRHAGESDLSVLNRDPRPLVSVRPTLAAALRAGELANQASEGLADITLLDARLAVEGGADGADASRQGEWRVLAGPRGSGIVERPSGLHFDLGGVGKGWIADRALDQLTDWPSAVVDADGDLAIRCAPGRCWDVGIDDPRTTGTNLATLRLAAPTGGYPARWGVATSGVSVHRWQVGGGAVRHHLIDPRTGRPAESDVIQATVVAWSSLRAEALAKAAVIAGTVQGFALLERSRVLGAVLLTDRGETLALPSTLPLLAG